VYCRYCGNQKVEEWTGEYDEDTGRKKMRLVCSVSPCAHYGHDTEYTNHVGFLSSALKARCKRCGKAWKCE
jgi:hypothetical protein